MAQHAMSLLTHDVQGGVLKGNETLPGKIYLYGSKTGNTMAA
jgi:hypothetical protein